MPIRLTRAVKALLIIYFMTFVVEQTADQFFGANLMGTFALIPSAVVIGHRFWQIFTYSFLHWDVMQLFFNLLLLAFFAGDLEAAWGTARFLRYYFFCATCAALCYLFLQFFKWSGDVPMVGASGALYGVLIAFGLIFGERVMLFMMLFPMKAKHFVWIFAVIEFMTTVFSARGGLAGLAQLGGMAAGFLYLWGKAAWIVARRRRRENQELFRREKRRKASKHLKLVINNFDPRKPGGPQGDDDTDSDGHPRTWH